MNEKQTKHDPRHMSSLELIATAREFAQEAQKLAPVMSEYAVKFARIGARGLRASGAALDAFLDEFDTNA